MLSLVRSRTRRADAVQVGVTAAGAPLLVPLARVSTLIAGLPGSGKSSTLAATVAGIAPLPDVAVVILDPKRITFLHTAPRCVVASGLDVCTRVLDDLGRIMDARYAELERARSDSWAGPSIVVLVDELAELMASGDRKTDRARTVALRRLLQLGRAAGIVVIGATQRPSASLIDSDARALFGARIAHALDGPDSVRMAGLDPELAPAHRIPLGAEHAGLAYLATDGTRTPIYGRVWHADRALVARACARHAGRRIDPFHELTQVGRGVPSCEVRAGASVAVNPTEAQRPAPAPWSPPVLPSEPEPTHTSSDPDRVLQALTAGPAVDAELRARTGLSEGRTRRARQELERAGRIINTSAGWRTITGGTSS